MGWLGALGVPVKIAFHSSAFVAALIIIRDSVFDIQGVTGSSMAPTLSPLWDTERAEDQILVSKLRFSERTPRDLFERKLSESDKRMRERALWRWNIHDLKRGDIVTFWSPASNELGLKRVVALAGDTVVPERRTRHGKGYRMLSADEMGHFDGTPRGMPKSLIVPWGHIWVEGDNSYHSQDSRDFGPISQALVTGKVMAVAWPWKRAGFLSSERPITQTSTVVTPGKPMVPLEYDE